MELSAGIVELYRSFLNWLVFLHFKSDKTVLDRSKTSKGEEIETLLGKNFRIVLKFKNRPFSQLGLAALT